MKLVEYGHLEEALGLHKGIATEKSLYVILEARGYSKKVIGKTIFHNELGLQMYEKHCIDVIERMGMKEIYDGLVSGSLKPEYLPENAKKLAWKKADSGIKRAIREIECFPDYEAISAKMKEYGWNYSSTAIRARKARNGSINAERSKKYIQLLTNMGDQEILDFAKRRNASRANMPKKAHDYFVKRQVEAIICGINSMGGIANPRKVSAHLKKRGIIIGDNALRDRAKKNGAIAEAMRIRSARAIYGSDPKKIAQNISSENWSTAFMREKEKKMVGKAIASIILSAIARIRRIPSTKELVEMMKSEGYAVSRDMLLRAKKSEPAIQTAIYERSRWLVINLNELELFGDVEYTHQKLLAMPEDAKEAYYRRLDSAIIGAIISMPVGDEPTCRGIALELEKRGLGEIRHRRVWQRVQANIVLRKAKELKNEIFLNASGHGGMPKTPAAGRGRADDYSGEFRQKLDIMLKINGEPAKNAQVMKKEKLTK